ncbi:hypothetical protein V1515DRAFT_226213 [Lipomyces mesembrius]
MPPPIAVTANKQASSSVNVIKYEKPTVQQQVIPDITPMRRGRLPPPLKQAPKSTEQPPPQPKRPQPVHSESESNQRPSYLPPPSPSPSPPNTADIDDADAAVSNRFPSIAVINLRPTPRRRPSQYSRDSSPERSQMSFDQLQPTFPTRPSFESDRSLSGVSISSLQQPQPQRPVTVSTGAVTSPEILQRREFSGGRHSRSHSSYPIISSEEMSRSASNSRPNSRTECVPIRAPSRGITPSWSRRPSAEINAGSRSSSFLFPRRPSSTSSNSGKARPVSMFLDSSMDFLRSIGSRSGPASPTGSVHSAYESSLRPSATGEPQINDHVESNVEFLKSLDMGRSRVVDYGSKTIPPSVAPQAGLERRSISVGSTVHKHGKKPSMSLKLTGKFGDAFRKFEHQQTTGSDRRMPSPEKKKDGFKFGRTTSSGKLFRQSMSGGKRAPTPPHIEKKESVSVTNTGTTGTNESWEVKSDEIPSPVRDAIERRIISQEQRREKEPAAERGSRLPTDISSDVPPAKHSRSSIDATPAPSGIKEPPKTFAFPSMDSARSVSPEKPPVPAKSPTIAAKAEPRIAAINSAPGPAVASARRPRATSIQNRVQQLLSQSQSSPVARTASGYGHYTDVESNTEDDPAGDGSNRAITIGSVPDHEVGETYVVIEPIRYVDAEPMRSDFELGGREITGKEFDEAKFLAHARQNTHHKPHNSHTSQVSQLELKSSESSKSQLPKHLRHEQASHKSDMGTVPVDNKPSPPPKPAQLQSASPKRVQKPLISPLINTQSAQPPNTGGDGDWQATFNKRYPSLSGLEQVEVKIRDMDVNIEGSDAGRSSSASSSRRRRVEGKV